MPKIVADPPASSCYHPFPEAGVEKFQGLILIRSCLARAMGAGGLRGEVPAIRAVGRPAFPIPGVACPISRPGR